MTRGVSISSLFPTLFAPRSAAVIVPSSISAETIVSFWISLLSTVLSVILSPLIAVIEAPLPEKDVAATAHVTFIPVFVVAIFAAPL